MQNVSYTVILVLKEIVCIFQIVVLCISSWMSIYGLTFHIFNCREIVAIFCVCWKCVFVRAYAPMCVWWNILIHTLDTQYCFWPIFLTCLLYQVQNCYLLPVISDAWKCLFSQISVFRRTFFPFQFLCGTLKQSEYLMEAYIQKVPQTMPKRWNELNDQCPAANHTICPVAHLFRQLRWGKCLLLKKYFS